jgi:ubiquinone/menaquinone biosynthesis C-methylase UbiE
MQDELDLKSEVKEFWDGKSCGEIYAEGDTERLFYDSESVRRYELEPYIPGFAKAHEGKDKDVLEIGVGMGTDHAEWAKSKPKSLNGIDLTPRAVAHTRKRLALLDLSSNINEGDAEQLPFSEESFDLVYSWGVLHHSPDTQRAINEVYRVLRPKGTARIMIYHKYSLTGYMLWIRYGLLKWHPCRSLGSIYHNYLESPGTKAYTVREAREMFSRFSRVDPRIQLGFVDLLEGSVGQRHRGTMLSLARALWPRKLIKKVFKNHGLMLLIEAQK